MKKILSQWLEYPYIRALFLLVLFILPATLIRLVLYFSYRDDFQSLGLVQVLTSLLVGLRFDVSMAVMLVGIPIILLLLPFRWSHHRYWQRLVGAFIYCTWLGFIALMVADMLYFGNVHRHIGSEVHTMSNDVNSMIGIALSQYKSALLLIALIALSGALLWWHLLYRIPAPPKRPWLRLAVLPLVFLLMAVVERGGYTGKPMGVGEAFFSDSLAQGYLAMNGAFAASRAWVELTPTVKVFMPQQQAVAMTQHFLASPDTKFETPEYPLMRHSSPAKIKGKPNVVVLMLESWGAIHIDALRREMNLPALGATPNFDRLAQQGRLYTHFYGNGQRSIQGAAAILASQPTFPGMPLLGLGMEQNRLSFMGQLAHAQGYQTIFLQSSDHNSFHFDTIAARAGFTSYFGAEEIPNLHEHPKPASTWGTWDHNTFQQANKLFSKADKPFMGFIFTSTTHTPWIIPDARWNKFTGGTDRDAFRNSLFYADWALGQLMDAAKQAGYFDNTIFIITADHVDEFVEGSKFVPNQFHIPLLILGPGVTPGIDQRVDSQFDIIPTLIDLCGWTTPYAGMGRSLLDDTRTDERASLSIRGEVLDWITPDGWVSHNLEKRVGTSKEMPSSRAENLEQQLLASYQSMIQMQLNNLFLPAGK
jgi:phosphoglycerol transferase MdoB-like AlkP superfamily enzyme